MSMETQEQAPQFLLIVRERLRPGSEEAYNQNELQLAAACAKFNCPHPYVSLVPVDGPEPKQVWWLNAFESAEERDGLGAAYARNESLMAALTPLGKRKEDFREAVTTTFAEYRPELSIGAQWRIAGARFLVIGSKPDQRGSPASVFESSDGKRFVMAAATTRDAAEATAAQFGVGAMILAVRPQWSFPDKAWIDADPGFWKSSPGALGGPDQQAQ
jgi:hypothetical protein